MTTPMIRPARDDDVPDVASLWYRGWLDGHAGLVPDELVAHRTPESFVPRTRDRVPLTRVAEVAGAVVGFVVVVEDEVEQLYVDARARGSGVAAQLLKRGEEVVRAAGHERAWLAVAEGNTRARRFYAREGWIDRGSFVYAAEVRGGTLDVPCRRYEVDLSRGVADRRRTVRKGSESRRN